MPKRSETQITEAVARNARPKEERYEIRDSLLTGFMLRVNPTGTKAWYVQLGRSRKRKISDAGLLSASVARYRARDMLIREAVTAGKSPATPGKRTLGEFLLGRYSDRNGQTSRYFKRDIRRLCSALGPLTLERLEYVGVSKLEQWKLARGRRVKPTTLNREIAMLKAAFEQAREWGHLTDNPARGIKLVRNVTTRPPRILNEQERAQLDAVLAGRNDRFATMVSLALNTGLKRNELFSLRWRDVYFGPYPSIIVEKPASRHQNKGRRIPLNREATSALLQWQATRSKRNYLVFPGPSGGQLKSVSYAWRRLMTQANLRDFRLNDCRDDFAARLTRAGVPLSQVRDLLGHSTLSLTEKYACFAPGEAADAVACLDRHPSSPGDSSEQP
jgi:integrase